MAAQRDQAFEQWYQRRYGVGPLWVDGLWVDGSGYVGVSAERYAGWVGSREQKEAQMTEQKKEPGSEPVGAKAQHPCYYAKHNYTPNCTGIGVKPRNDFWLCEPCYERNTAAIKRYDEQQESFYRATPQPAEQGEPWNPRLHGTGPFSADLDASPQPSPPQAEEK